MSMGLWGAGITGGRSSTGGARASTGAAIDVGAAGDASGDNASGAPSVPSTGAETGAADAGSGADKFTAPAGISATDATGGGGVETGAAATGATTGEGAAVVVIVVVVAFAAGTAGVVGGVTAGVATGVTGGVVGTAPTTTGGASTSCVSPLLGAACTPQESTFLALTIHSCDTNSKGHGGNRHHATVISLCWTGLFALDYAHSGGFYSLCEKWLWLASGRQNGIASQHTRKMHSRALCITRRYWTVLSEKLMEGCTLQKDQGDGAVRKLYAATVFTMPARLCAR
jgi:hypothetical protein